MSGGWAASWLEDEPEETSGWTPEGAGSQRNWAKLSGLSLKREGRKGNGEFPQQGTHLVGWAWSISEQERMRGGYSNKSGFQPSPLLFSIQVLHLLSGCNYSLVVGEGVKIAPAPPSRGGK